MQIDDAREFIKFLHGAVPWNGTWFGEYAPGERGAYWWRKHLDEAIAALIAAPAAPQQAEPVAKIIRNDSGQVRMVDGSGEPFDMFAHVGQSYYAHPPAAEVQRLREALHQISLVSQNSAGSKDECGRIARRALEGGE